MFPCRHRGIFPGEALPGLNSATCSNVTEFNLETFTHFCLQDLISFMDKMVRNKWAKGKCSSQVTCPSGPPSPFHRSPWWVTTGAAPWFGLWPGIFQRESGTMSELLTFSHIWKFKWNMSFLWRAVASLNTPLFPPDPSKPASEKLKALPAFDYQIYFQKPVSLCFTGRTRTGSRPVLPNNISAFNAQNNKYLQLWL